MKLLETSGKKFRLASRFARIFAFFLDIIIIFGLSVILSVIIIFGLSATLSVFSRVFFGFPFVFFLLFLFLFWCCGMLFLDGFRNGRGIGKRILSMQVIRLRDGEPCTFKDSFIRRLTSFFQPFDVLFWLGNKKQRMGDLLAETVVVKYEPHIQYDVPEKESPEKVLENAIVAITSRLTEAKEKVDTSIGIEKQFQGAYEGALVQAERCEEKATIAIQAGREDLAREDIKQRNEYKQRAEHYQKQWEEQKQVVARLTNLLETLEMKTEEAERKRDLVIAQQKNVDAQQHLQETLTEVEDGAAFDILNKMERDVTEAATLAKAASEVDVDIRDVESREFTNYAEDAAIEKELADLKQKMR